MLSLFLTVEILVMYFDMCRINTKNQQLAKQLSGVFIHNVLFEEPTAKKVSGIFVHPVGL